MNTASQGVYAPSGRMGTALVLVPMAAIVASFVLGVAYAYVDVYSPIVGYISLIFVAVFGVALGWSISQIGLFAKCRNPAFMRLVGLGSGLVALYVAWATFTYANFARHDETFTATLGDVLGSPVAIWEIAQAINAEGWYSVASWTPTGMVLWIFWGIEALIVVGAPFVLATMAIDDQVFCERCGLWCGRVEGVIGLTLPETESQLQDLRPDNLAPLETLQTAANRDLPHLRVDTWECGRCRNTTVLQLKMATKLTDEEGKVEEQTQDLTAMWSVTPRDLHNVKKLARRPQEAQQAAAEMS